MFTLRAECTRCGASCSSDKVLNVCEKCGGALLLKFDLDKVSQALSKSIISNRDDTFWKFAELLPISSIQHIVSLGEPYTPLLRLPSGTGVSLENVFIKDDGWLPSGSFKARGMAVAVSRLNELRVKRIAVPSAGNAASALAAYGGKAGMEVYAFMPRDTPRLILEECLSLGAKTYLVDGLINDAGEIVKKLDGKYHWFNISTNRQPYRVEGYKAIAYEISEQSNWNPPDTIIFPTGGGEGVIGLWKGFSELAELGWTTKIPRLIVVQAEGCAPLVKAFVDNESEVKEPWKNAETIAAGLKVPYPFAGYLVLRAVRRMKGLAITVNDAEIMSAMNALMRKGIYACPEASATLAALKKLETQKTIDPHETVMLYLTGNAMKYLSVMKTNLGQLPILKHGATSLDDES